MDEPILVIVCQQSGFMRDFKLTAIITDNQQLPLSGPGVAYYRKGDEQYSLQTSWVNGKKEGSGTLFNSHNQICAQLSFSNDEINGECIIRDNMGTIRFRGQMVNGMKEGPCEEFNKSGARIFSGYYEGGNQHSLFQPRKGVPGFWEEFSRDRVLLTMSEYDSRNTFKNGRCFFFEQGKVAKCVIMEMGKEKYVCSRYQEDMMTCYNEKGKVIYEGGYSHSVDKLFCREGQGREYNDSGCVVYDGLYSNGEHVQRIREIRGWKVVVDEQTSKLVQAYQTDSRGVRNGTCKYYENKVIVKITEWEKGKEIRTVSEITDSRMRIYGTNGNLCYEGGHSDKQLTWTNREGNGTEYLDDGITISYIGHFSEDKRSGYGTWYSGGIPMYIGEWKDGVPNGQGTLVNEIGYVICEGIWEWGYLLTTKGWIDYESKKLYNVKNKTTLPKWAKRGGITTSRIRLLKYSHILLECWEGFLNCVEIIFFWVSSVLCLLIATYLSFLYRSHSWFSWSCVVCFVAFFVFILIFCDNWFDKKEIPSWFIAFLPFYGLHISFAISCLQFMRLMKRSWFFYVFIFLFIPGMLLVGCIDASFFDLAVEALNSSTLVFFTHYIGNSWKTNAGIILSFCFLIYSLVICCIDYYYLCVISPFINAVFFFVLFCNTSSIVLYGGIGLLSYITVVTVLVILGHSEYHMHNLRMSCKTKRDQWVFASRQLHPSQAPVGIIDDGITPLLPTEEREYFKGKAIV